MNQLLRLSAAGLVLACSARVPSGAAVNVNADLAPLQPGLDYHSFANVEQFRVTHLELDLHVDFVNKVMFGAVALEIKRLDPRATELVLDTRDLDIRDVEEKAINVLGALAKSETTWVSRPFHLDKADPILGSPLVIELPLSSRKATEIIRIDYVTSPTAPALQWLGPKQPAGRHQPLMFTMSEALGARSWIPLQDTPQVRATYSAHIHTPSDLLAVMSAKNDPKVKRTGEYSFDMPEAIPSYLIALAVGDLRFKETGPRTGVYAEKAELSAAAKEFSDAEALLRTGEKLISPYRFDRFDIVVMPPSFPLGGTGNPRAPFISPTVIAGDKSLVSVVARELAHAWAGGLVSNATWRDLWLNEGFADYLESRIMNEVYGERREAMERVLGLRSLRDDLAKLKSQDQALAIDLRDRDPASGFRDARPEKGGLFLTFLDAKFGRERFDLFLRGYFDHFASKSITTEQFLSYLGDNLLDRFPGIVTRAQAMQWVMGPGIPADAVLPSTDAFGPVDAARKVWLDGKLPAKKLDTRDWVAPQWQYFLGQMPAGLRKDQLADLDQAFGHAWSGNAEVAHNWLLLVIRNAYGPSFPRLEEYLRTIGRGKLITPLYEELMKTPAGAAMAKRVYALARPTYHPRTVAAVDPIVNPRSETQDDE
jgi:leukotriene-A4 hydrolase